MKKQNFLALALMVLAIARPGVTAADDDPALQDALRKAQEQPVDIEVYYEIKDGHEREFLELYKKNHWPVLNAEIAEGSLISVDVDRQPSMPPGAHQWDLRVTMVFSNILYRHGLLERPKEAIISRLYPDRALFDQEERRRFELVDHVYIVDRIRLPTSEWLTEGTQGSSE